MPAAATQGCWRQKSGRLDKGAYNSAPDVEAVIEPVRSKYPTEIAFGMAQTSSIREAVQKLEEQGVREIAVVRMFVSGDSFVLSTEYILGLRNTPPLDPLASRGNEHVKPDAAASQAIAHEASLASNHGSIHADPAGHGPQGNAHSGHCMEPPQPIESRSQFILSYEGVGESALIDEILQVRVKSLSTDPRHESILILAHGPADDRENELWLANMNRRMQRLHESGPFRAIQCETLREDWPDRRQAAERRIRDFVEKSGRDGGRCIVVPFRVAGFGPHKDVLAGLNYVADEKGLCPHPNMTKWVEQTAHKCWQ